MRSGHLRDPDFLVRDRRASRDISKILFDFFPGGFYVNVTCKDNDHVRRAVIGLEPFLHVVHGSGVEIGHVADNGPGIRVARRVGILGDELARNGVRLVLALPLFVLHDAALQVQSLLIQRTEQKSHAVRFHPEGVVKRRGGNIFKIIGAVVVGRSVEVGCSDFFHGVNVPARRMFASAKHQVLE